MTAIPPPIVEVGLELLPGPLRPIRMTAKVRVRCCDGRGQESIGRVACLALVRILYGPQSMGNEKRDSRHYARSPAASRVEVKISIPIDPRGIDQIPDRGVVDAASKGSHVLLSTRTMPHRPAAQATLAVYEGMTQGDRESRHRCETKQRYRGGDELSPFARVRSKGHQVCVVGGPRMRTRSHRPSRRSRCASYSREPR